MSKIQRRSISNAQASAEEHVELENQFILRLPLDTARKVRHRLQEGGSSVRDKMSIQFQPDMRHAQVKVDNEIFYGKLVDLPCMIETLKTLDKKTFYKVTDIAQMLVCKREEDTTEEEMRQKEQGKNEGHHKKKDKQYQWQHGITEPLKNVRKRRFRKTLKKKYMDAPELEKELKRLLREDMEAGSVRWEIVTAEQEMQQKLNAQKRKLEQQEGRGDSVVNAGQASSSQGPSDLPISRVDELFGGALSSSSDEGSEVEQIVDSDGENDVTISSVGTGTPWQQPGSVANTIVEDDEEIVDER